jgi:hypothetical protein
VGNQRGYGAVGMVLAKGVQAVGSLLSMGCACFVNGISTAECWLSICPRPILYSKSIYIQLFVDLILFQAKIGEKQAFL